MTIKKLKNKRQNEEKRREWAADKKDPNKSQTRYRHSDNAKGKGNGPKV
jgi:hypothetical protein